MKALFVALSAAGLLFASQTAAASSETVAISVSSDGLDLTQRADMRKFRARVADAAAEACDPADRMIVTTLPDYRCRRDAVAAAEPMVQTMAMAARRTSVARKR